MHSTMNLVGVAALVASLNAPIPSVQAPELAWPDAFASPPASEVGAHQHVVDPAATYLPPGRAGSIASNSSCVHGRVRLAVSTRVALTVAASTGSPVCPHSRRM